MAKDKNWREMSTCEGKFPFASYSLAQQSVNRRPSGKKRRGNIHPYRCPYCQQWHVGNHKKKETK